MSLCAVNTIMRERLGLTERMTGLYEGVIAKKRNS